MANENAVSVDTDNLDDFTALFSGKATEKPVEPVVEETPEEDVDPLATEPNEPAEIEEEEELVDVDPTDEDKSKLQLKPKKKTVQERINELTAKAREAERREADVRRRLDELTAEKAKTVEPEKQAPPAVESAEPNPDAVNADGTPKYPLGEFDPAFLRDTTKFFFDQERARIAALDEAAKQEEAHRAEVAAHEQARAELAQGWEQKLSAVETDLPDIRTKGAALEATLTGVNNDYGEYLASTIMAMDHGPEVLYYLADHLDEAQKIIDSGPVLATIALGRLEAQFGSKEKPQPVKVSQAPDPAPVLARGSGAVGSVPIDTDDLDAFSDSFFKKR